MTSLVLDAAPSHAEPSLCVLGAGNCFDLDLESLARRFSAISLVDLDASALQRTFERQSEATRARLQLHAPIDLSGFLDCIDRWAEFRLTPEELMTHPAQTEQKIKRQLAKQFDVVLSSCILSQMQLSLLNVLGERHRLLDALRLVLNLTHWRTLAGLTQAGGCALFATDASSSELYPLEKVEPGADCRELLSELVRQRKVFAFAEPAQIASQLSDEPHLRRAFAASQLRDAWIWSNGPDAKFLVYASALPRV